MKTKLLFLLLFTAIVANSQTRQPFSNIGKKVKVVTLTDGKYDEFFDENPLQRVGSSVINVKTRKITKMEISQAEIDELENAQASRFLSVDPLTKKYPELTPYQFASNRPIDGIDLDGKEYLNSTSVFTGGGGIAAGLAYGVNYGARVGTAYDMIGKTQFVLYSNIDPTKQDLRDGSRNPVMIEGAEIGVDFSFQIVHKPTFAQSMNSMGLSMSTVSAKLGLGGSVSFGSDNFGLSVGYGIGGTIKTGNQTQVAISISITNQESKSKTHGLSVWSISSIEPERDKNGKITGYASDLLEVDLTNPQIPIVRNTGIKIHSDAVTITKEIKGKKVETIKPLNNWKSDDYKKAETKIENE